MATVIRTTESPVIPFLEMELQHLAQIIEAEPGIIDGKVNLSAMSRVSRSLERLVSYRQKSYNWPQITGVQLKLAELESSPNIIYDEDALYACSTFIEPLLGTSVPMPLALSEYLKKTALTKIKRNKKNVFRTTINKLRTEKEKGEKYKSDSEDEDNVEDSSATSSYTNSTATKNSTNNPNSAIEITKSEIEYLTLDQLFNRLLADPKCDLASHFVLAYSTLLNANQFIDKLIEKFKNSEEKEIKMNSLVLLNLWIDKQWHQFQDKSSYVYKAVMDLCSLIEKEPHGTTDHNSSNTNSNMGLPSSGYSTQIQESAAIIQQSLNNNPRRKLTRTLISNSKPSNPNNTTQNNPRSRSSNDFTNPLSATSVMTVWDIDSMEFARQMTLKDFKQFSKIKPQEFLKQSWLKPNKETLSPNICKITARFNHMSDWFKTIVLTESNLRRRIKVVVKLLEICEHLWRLNNLNGVFQVVSALQSGPVHRLKQTLEGFSHNKVAMANWQKAMDITGHVSQLREALTNATPPVVPYIGMYLTDFVGLDEGNQDFGSNGGINIRKIALLGRTLAEIQEYQKHSYEHQPVEQIKQFLKSMNPPAEHDDSLLWECSHFIEPRSGSQPTEPPEIIQRYSSKEPLTQIQYSPEPKKWSKLKAISLSKLNKFSVTPAKPVLSKRSEGAKLKLKKTTEAPLPQDIEQLLSNHRMQLDSMFNQRMESLTFVFDTLDAEIRKMHQVLHEVRETSVNEIRNEHNAALTQLAILQQQLEAHDWKSDAKLEHEDNNSQ